MFYPDIKLHCSPSAFAQWHRQKTAFVRSYFKGEKSPETAAMKAGKLIHALIENGIIPAKYRFQAREKKLEVMLSNGVKILGIPDSHEEGTGNETVSFVDYKTGREDHWSREEIAQDLKMLLTAWLVMKANPGAKDVKAIIEWIGTEWNGAELVPTGETAYYEYVFPHADLVDLEEKAIIPTIDAINVAYEEFLALPEEDLVDENDVRAFAELCKEIDEREVKLKAIKDRIKDQLEFSGKQTYESEFGVFYFTARKEYQYPPELAFKTASGDEYNVKKGEEIELAMSVAKKFYELDHEPSKISKSFAFKAKKK